jgi:hypothetical protein
MSLKSLEAAADYLKPGNPRLEELKMRYARVSTDATAPMHWTDSYVTPEEIQNFRGDNAYVWQLRGDNMTAGAYALTTCYIESIDHLGLMDRLEEDGLFGVCTFDVGGRRLENNDGKDFSGVIARHGYRLVAMEPKYRDESVQANAINPTCHYLFKLESGSL